MGYTIILVIADLFASLVVNLIQENPEVVIVTSGVVRLSFLFVLFPTVGWIVSSFLNKGPTSLILIITSVIVYFVIPITVYLLKDNNESLLSVFVDLHSKFYLFSLVLLPYIVSSIISFILWVVFLKKNIVACFSAN
jgi:hypothetical protein